MTEEGLAEVKTVALQCYLRDVRIMYHDDAMILGACQDFAALYLKQSPMIWARWHAQMRDNVWPHDCSYKPSADVMDRLRPYLWHQKVSFPPYTWTSIYSLFDRLASYLLTPKDRSWAFFVLRAKWSKAQWQQWWQSAWDTDHRQVVVDLCQTVGCPKQSGDCQCCRPDWNTTPLMLEELGA